MHIFQYYILYIKFIILSTHVTISNSLDVFRWLFLNLKLNYVSLKFVICFLPNHSEYLVSYGASL